MTEVVMESAQNSGEIWSPMQATVADFRSECSGLEQMIQGLFDDLDHLRVELERKALELASEQQRNAEHETLLQQQREDAQKLTERLEAQEERLAGTFTALNEMRDHFRREREEVTARGKEFDQSAQDRIQQLEEESKALRKQLDESASELRSMSHVTLELAESREKLSQAQGEIIDLREQLHTTAAANVDSTEFQKTERERDELRDEVELLRDRAVELSQNLVDQKVEMDRQREELTNELKHLRKFVEMQTEMMMNRSPGGGAPASGKSSDAVTSAVMAQFSKVQRDASERRKAKSTP